MAQYKSQEYIGKRIIEIESRITELCKQGTDLVPVPEAIPEIKLLRRELIDITDGENTIIFDKAGRPSPVFVIECDKYARADQNTEYLGSEASTYTDSWGSVLPGLVRNGKPVKYLFTQKYRCVRWNGKNYPIGLYGMPHAHSSYGGMTMSYDGINSACDTLNALPTMADGHKMHEITADEYAILALSFARNAFEPHGNDSSGRSCQDSSEIGSPCDFTYQNMMRHTLTGSGPDTWRHNGSKTGIADIRGNTRFPLAGFRTMGGEFQIIDFRNTDGCLSSSQLGSAGDWKAIQEGGALVAPGTENTYKIDFINPASSNGTTGHRINKTIVNRGANGIYSAIAGKSVKLAEGVQTAPILKYLNLLPYDLNPLLGQQYFVNSADAERIAMCFASWADGSGGGGSYRHGYCTRSSADNHTGGLLASHGDSLED